MRATVAKRALEDSSNGRCDLEVADIFQRYGEQYRSEHKLTSIQHAAMFDIEHCRTSYFGYHVDVCDQCGNLDHGYNSCRNRHCPKCQGIAQRKWVAARMANLLPMPYYHVVFTLPHIINPLVPYNKELLYEAIFDCASKSLLQFGKDPKCLGATIGFYGILHSWGGKLWNHLHVHFVVPAGGVDSQGRWIEPRYKGRFLFPVHAVSRVFRGKFVQQLKCAYYQNRLVLPQGYQHLSNPVHFERYIDSLVGRNWNINVKRPFSTPQRVVHYIGRYTHKVAISNNRLIKIENDRVHFHFKNYRKNGRWMQTSLAAKDFISRFLIHVLPEGFHKIRHYGFLANGRCKAMLQKIREQLEQEQTSRQIAADIIGQKCPQCPKGVMRTIAIFGRYFSILSLDYRPMSLFKQLDST